MKSIFHLIAILTLLLITSSCSKETTETKASLDASLAFASVASTNFTVLKSIQASNEANQLRSPDYSALFEISKINRNKESLQISLTYPVGCGDSKFEVIWNGITTTTSPKTIIIYLRRTSVCAGLAASSSQALSGNSVSQVFSINLTEWLSDASLGQTVTVLLCNTSKKTNTENSDILASVN
ncbi:MAG: hypothetical protein WCP08_13950 [Prolixibacteraceae bacterium]